MSKENNTGIDWGGVDKTISDSAYTLEYLCRAHGVDRSRFFKWMTGEVSPSKRSLIKLNLIIETASKRKKHEFHPSYGYATKQEVHILSSLGISDETRGLILEIEKRNKLGGKIA